MPWGLLFFVAGLILILEGAGWFAGAVTVGWVLVIVSLVIFIISLAIVGAVIGRR